MKRSLSISVLVMMALATSLWTVDAWARAGGGSTSGSRGSRSYSAPAQSPSSGTSSPSRQSAPPPSPYAQQPQRSGFFGGLMGGIGGLLLGGLIGSMLFGGMRGGMGFGLMEIIILGVLAYLAFAWFRRRQQQQPALAGMPGYAPAPVDYRPPAESRATAVEPVAASSQLDRGDLERGLGHIRQTDVGFDPARFGQTASQTFFRIQSAWSSRDLGPVRDLLTPEMVGVLQADLDRLRAQGRANRIENMLMQGAEVTEAWQESGQDFATVRLAASLLDYTVEEGSGRVVEGSRTEPVSFEEYWTFARPVGPNRWRLTAIQQP